MYGSVNNRTSGQVLSSGTVNWSIAGGGSGASISAPIVNVNGQFFYIARIPYKNASDGCRLVLVLPLALSTGLGAAAVAMADLDQDGRPDLVVANQGINTISILRNTGSNSAWVAFAPRVDLPTGAGPYRLAVGDIDGDGKPEIAVSNSRGGSVSVSQNTSSPGSIAFAQKVDFATTGTQPSGCISIRVWVRGHPPYPLFIGTGFEGGGEKNQEPRQPHLHSVTFRLF